jgi:hypothetical protein
MRKSAFSLVVILTVTIVIVNFFGTCYAQQSLPIGGKGIYLWQIWTANSGGKNLNTIIAKLKSTGISWIVIKMGDGDSFYNSAGKLLYSWATTNYSSMDSVISIFHSNGIKLLAFQYVYGVPHYWGNTWSETDVANWILDVKGIDGLMIDAEVEYDNLANRVDAARTYCDSIRAHHPNSLVGLTSWARPNSHPTFPWTTFLDRVAINMPQAYWSARPTTPQNELNLLSSQFTSNTNNWVSQGDSAAAKPIMPIGSAYGTVNQGEVASFCAACQTTYNYPGVSLWEYNQVSNSYEWDEYAVVWTATSVSNAQFSPIQYSLSQNYPNPFNPTTNISFSLPARAYVSLKIFSLVGREVATLVSGEVEAGRYVRQWNAAGCASGMYFYRLSVVPSARRDLVPTDSRNGQTGTYSDTKKLVLVK